MRTSRPTCPRAMPTDHGRSSATARNSHSLGARPVAGRVLHVGHQRCVQKEGGTPRITTYEFMSRCTDDSSSALSLVCLMECFVFVNLSNPPASQRSELRTSKDGLLPASTECFQSGRYQTAVRGPTDWRGGVRLSSACLVQSLVRRTRAASCLTGPRVVGGCACGTRAQISFQFA